MTISPRETEMRATFDCESPRFPRSDWQHEVADGDTTLGYWEWLAHRYECEQVDPNLDRDSVIAEWAGVHYKVNFDCATDTKKAELRDRYVEAASG